MDEKPHVPVKKVWIPDWYWTIIWSLFGTMITTTLLSIIASLFGAVVVLNEKRFDPLEIQCIVALVLALSALALFFIGVRIFPMKVVELKGD